jgi:antitoxin CcdA
MRIMPTSHKSAYDAHARKRPVNLTLNEDLIHQAKGVTDNLSGVVETLLADFVVQQKRARLLKAQTVETTIAAWNQFNAKNGSIADEYSSL